MAQVVAKKTPVSDFVTMQDFILVKPVPLERGEVVTESGIVVGMTQNQGVSDRPTFGEVLGVGPDVEVIKVGYEVFWPMQDGLDLEFSDGEYALFREKSIIGYKRPKG